MAQVSLTNIRIPEPNPAVAAAQMSPRMRRILEQITHTGVLLYQSRVKKRSRRLALSARGSVDVGGHHHNMLVGTITVGQGIDYELPHEFGAEVPLFGDDQKEFHQKASRDLNFVLEHLGQF
ncbi:hypothetical protein SEA_NAIRB_12 [Mycobacterium phage Nairb]|uniref:Uncharacterized protein n=5 Tax=Bernalvirus bernal13 TaxID=1982102 RepID=A0A2P1JRM8_9CAUD|nr:neck protein [Mycobacterium phage Bernal13]AIT13425.1 hypothetical protein PBI_RONRAYGUN_12 [Mycobacterium phage RonRayGun]ASJ79093.1 hypothetical protein SEA_ZENTIME222_12 [Mycobacterium phage ZenTime222]AVO21800.1 hypothetical protein SEA_NAIRB_12 [Mycobacterium phage Nairb]QBP28857.1 hypothetical protein SEA_IBRAHIM_12 [Mycobacterium phage Ibrahim]QHB47418.1 hypothetical protein SEA_WHITTY_12 [Mycobacterium phage Whitty]